MNANPFMCRTSSLLEKGQLFRNTLPDQKSILVRYSLTCNAQNLLELYSFQYKVYISFFLCHPIILLLVLILNHIGWNPLFTLPYMYTGLSTYMQKGQTALDTKDKV